MKGQLVLILGPSGVGKGSVIARLKEEHAEFIFPISATTRVIRQGEKEGDVYNFLSLERFKDGIRNDEFLEWAVVHQDNYYGTLKKPILDGINNGKIVIRELDIQGFKSISNILTKDQYVSVFLIPPSLGVLKKRIIQRAKMDDEELQKRMDSAKNEIQQSSLCDYQIISVDGRIDEIVHQIEDIIKKHTNGI